MCTAHNVRAHGWEPAPCRAAPSPASSTILSASCCSRWPRPRPSPCVHKFLSSQPPCGRCSWHGWVTNQAVQPHEPCWSREG